MDSENQQSNEFTPFLNVINEWYCRDISRKIKRAFRARNEAGVHYGAYAPIGYIKDPDKKGRLLIDEDTRWIVGYIRYDVLYVFVLSRLQYWFKEVQQDEGKLPQRLLKSSGNERDMAKKKAVSGLKKAQKRQAEIDALFSRMYEDRVTGKITERNFTMLSDKYQTEQEELAQTIETLQKQIAQDAQESVDAEKWIALIKQYAYPTELTAELLNAFIEKILVHEAVKDENGDRVQKVEICYRFIGKID